MSAPSTPNAHEELLDPGTELSRSISILDDLVQALLSEIPSSKPWQRQLLLHLAHVARSVQILRMTIAMERSKDDVCEAARRVYQALRATHAAVTTGRADVGTKTSVSIAMQASKRISKSLLD